MMTVITKCPSLVLSPDTSYNKKLSFLLLPHSLLLLASRDSNSESFLGLFHVSCPFKITLVVAQKNVIPVNMTSRGLFVGLVLVPPKYSQVVVKSIVVNSICGSFL
jgi:hypothetical protein